MRFLVVEVAAIYFDDTATDVLNFLRGAALANIKKSKW